MRIANCTTAAQYFHLLRRQALLLESDPLSLIVMTPKSLLRHPLVASSVRDLAEDHWHGILDDAEAQQRAGQVRRVLLCSGKMYIDLVSSELRKQSDSIAIVRMEQLYPFPAIELAATLNGYPALEEIVWVQEEPENMGAWQFVNPLLTSLINGRWSLQYVGRSASSSPAEGSSAWHNAKQERLVKQAYALAEKATILENK